MIHGNALSVTDWGEDHMPMRLMTDCKSLYDHISKEGSLPDGRWTAIHICALREVISAGPQRDDAKASLRWVNSERQLADGLAKEGLGDRMRSVLDKSVIRLHELSAQETKRRAKEQVSDDKEVLFCAKRSEVACRCR